VDTRCPEAGPAMEVVSKCYELLGWVYDGGVFDVRKRKLENFTL
jgi:hypothetical protein